MQQLRARIEWAIRAKAFNCCHVFAHACQKASLAPRVGPIKPRPPNHPGRRVADLGPWSSAPVREVAPWRTMLTFVAPKPEAMQTTKTYPARGPTRRAGVWCNKEGEVWKDGARNETYASTHIPPKYGEVVTYRAGTDAQNRNQEPPDEAAADSARNVATGLRRRDQLEEPTLGRVGATINGTPRRHAAGRAHAHQFPAADERRGVSDMDRRAWGCSGLTPDALGQHALTTPGGHTFCVCASVPLCLRSETFV